MPIHRVVTAVSACVAGFATAHASANLLLPSHSDGAAGDAPNPPKTSWIQRVLVSDADLNPSYATASIEDIMLKLKPRENKPGKVLAWGGIFGRSPVHIDTLSDRTMAAVVGRNGLGAAVDDVGNALVFGFDPKH